MTGSKRKKQYQRALQRAKGYDFLSPAESCAMDFTGVSQTFKDTALFCVAPALASYVIWILTDAVNRKIPSLYFLSRDGLVLFEIAKALCAAWKLPIECKYLYVSRYALRLPMYAINKKYAVEKMCQYLFGCTPGIILKRAGIDRDIDVGIPPDKVLTGRELSLLKQNLINNPLFDKLAEEAAADALKAAKAYLDQELTDDFAVVDLGWYGSLQECLTLLLNRKTEGYYFGMFRQVPDDFGSVHSFLFSNKKEYMKFPWFYHNLLECMCAASHGATMGYKYETDAWHPILSKQETNPGCREWSAKVQIDLCRAYAESFAVNNPVVISGALKSELAKTAFSLLKPIMFKPTVREAEVFGSIPFTDATTVENYTALARKLTKEEITKKSLSRSLIRSLINGRGSNKITEPIYWMRGSLALSKANALQRTDTFLLDWAYRLVVG